MTATQTIPPGGRVLRLAPDDEADLRSVAGHEISHALVADAFGLHPRSYVAGPSCGACFHWEPKTANQAAAISWAGYVGEDLLNVRNKRRTIPSVALTKDTFDRWHAEMSSKAGLAQMSPQDRKAIQSFPVKSACELALRISSEHLDLLRQGAAALADESRDRYSAAMARNDPETDERDAQEFIDEWKHVHDREAAINSEAFAAEILGNAAPMPPCGFPASVENFVRVVVAGGGTITQEAAKMVSDWAQNLRMRGGHGERLRYDFQTASEWRHHLHDFRIWLESKRRDKP